jgi:subtilisin family serine protease
MTDQQDQPRSAYGDHIDFAAPGTQLYSTTTNSTYEADSGTSYSAPLLAGIAAWIMSVNPALGPEEIELILNESCADLGEPGWDHHFGWGRIDFAEVARRTFATLPVSRIVALGGDPFAVGTAYREGARYQLYRKPQLGAAAWEPVQDAALSVENGMVILRDPAPGAQQVFYAVGVTLED